MDPDFTINKAKKRIRQKEAIKQQSDILKGKADISTSDIEGLKYKHKAIKKPDSLLPSSFKKCICCGKAKASSGEMPCQRCHMLQMS